MPTNHRIGMVLLSNQKHVYRRYCVFKIKQSELQNLSSAVVQRKVQRIVQMALRVGLLCQTSYNVTQTTVIKLICVRSMSCVCGGCFNLLYKDNMCFTKWTKNVLSLNYVISRDTIKRTHFGVFAANILFIHKLPCSFVTFSLRDNSCTCIISMDYKT